MLTQRLLGLLPVLLHGRARGHRIIGLGSGVTVGSALAPGTVQHADVVEISPEVVEASRFFDRENGGALARPGVRLIVGDGRSHLLLTPQRYDVIVSEPSNPWMAGVAALFTREFFEAARARLKPDGLLCQWAHTYDISRDDLQSIVATFASVFPQGTMWLVGDGDLLLIGAERRRDHRRGSTAMAPAVGKATTSAALAARRHRRETAPFDLLSLYAGGPASSSATAQARSSRPTTARRSSTRRRAASTAGPRTTTPRRSARSAATCRPRCATRSNAPTDAPGRRAGTMQLKAEAFALAYDAFRRAVDAQLAATPRRWPVLSDAAAGARKQDEERELLDDDRRRASRPMRRSASSCRACWPSRATSTARSRRGTEALRLAPDDPRAGEQLASIVADAGDADRLAPLGRRAGRAISRTAGPAVLPRDGAVPAWTRPKRRLRPARRSSTSIPTTRARRTCSAPRAPRWAGGTARRRRSRRRSAPDPRDPSALRQPRRLLACRSANPQAAASYFAEALADRSGVRRPRATGSRKRALLLAQRFDAEIALQRSESERRSRATYSSIACARVCPTVSRR